MNIPIKFKCTCGEKLKIPNPIIGEELACTCNKKWVVSHERHGHGLEVCPVDDKGEKKGELIKMNIQSELHEQLEQLKFIMASANREGDARLAFDISKEIIELILLMDAADCEEDELPLMCEECEEALLKQSLHQDIANACNMPIDIVNRVMAGQDEVLDLD